MSATTGGLRITIFQEALLGLSILTFALGWLKGGHPERVGVLVMMVAYVVSVLGSQVRVGDVFVVDVISDVVLTLIFGWLAIRADRWWPVAVTGVMALTLGVHMSAALGTEVGLKAQVSARVGLGLLLILVMLIGVAERWLAGERAVSESRPWRRAARTP